MAYQSPKKLDELAARQLAIRIAVCPIMNDPKTSKLLKAYQRAALSRPLIAQDAQSQWSVADQVLREALANSDDDDVRYFPQQRGKP